MKTIITLFAFLTIFSVNTLAQHIPSTILEGHTFAIDNIAFSPDGRRLVSWSWGRGDPIRLWDGVSGEHIATLEGHTDFVYVIFNPDGRRLASESWGDPIRLWDGVSGEHIATLEDAFGIFFSPDGRILASGVGIRTGRSVCGMVSLVNI